MRRGWCRWRKWGKDKLLIDEQLIHHDNVDYYYDDDGDYDSDGDRSTSVTGGHR